MKKFLMNIFRKFDDQHLSEKGHLLISDLLSDKINQ